MPRIKPRSARGKRPEAESHPKGLEVEKVSDHLVLDESRRDFLEKKLAQYNKRVKATDGRRAYWAPELGQEWLSYYDARAKAELTKMLLDNKEVNKSDFNDRMLKVLKGEMHRDYLAPAADTAWQVIDAYNANQMDKLSGSEPV